jgi:hypothetical protein
VHLCVLPPLSWIKSKWSAASSAGTLTLTSAFPTLSKRLPVAFASQSALGRDRTYGPNCSRQWPSASITSLPRQKHTIHDDAHHTDVIGLIAAFALRHSKGIGSHLPAISSRYITALLLIVVADVFAAPPNPSLVTRGVEQARLAFEQGDNAQVVEIVRRDLEHGESAELRNLLGKALGRLGERAKAVGELQSAIRLQPDDEGFRFDLGQFLLRNSDFGTAATVLEDAHQRLPRSAQIELALGVAYYCSVRYDDAVRGCGTSGASSMVFRNAPTFSSVRYLNTQVPICRKS